MGRPDRPHPHLSLGRLCHRRPSCRSAPARRGPVPDHGVGWTVDRDHPAGQLSDPADVAAGFQSAERRPGRGNAARCRAAFRRPCDPARLRQPFRDPPAAARRRDRGQHCGARLCAVDRGQHSRHLSACLLVHPELRHAADARGIRSRAGRDLDRRPVAAPPALCLLRSCRDHRLDLSAVRDQATPGRSASVREGVRVSLHPGSAGRIEDRADPE